LDIQISRLLRFRMRSEKARFVGKRIHSERNFGHRSKREDNVP